MGEGERVAEGIERRVRGERGWGGERERRESGERNKEKKKEVSTSEVVDTGDKVVPRGKKRKGKEK